MVTPRKRAFRFSGSSYVKELSCTLRSCCKSAGLQQQNGMRACRPAYPGFMVMKKPTRESSATVEPSVNTNCFLRSLIALSTQYTCQQKRHVRYIYRVGHAI